MYPRSSFPLAESLESRFLPSATSLTRGVLTIQGAEQGSTITVGLNATNRRQLVVTVDGTSQTLAKGLVRSITVEGGAGPNNISISDQVLIPATILGGAGNDTIVGGGGPELLQAGSGNALLQAGTGQQTLEGGAGNDTLYGGAAHDLLEGGDGANLLIAGSGPNQLYAGENGNNTLYGGSGNDTLGGANQDDLLFDGQSPPSSLYAAGNDSIVCGSGNDWVVGGDSEQFHQPNTIIAGSGHDVLDGRDGDVIEGQKPGDIIPSDDQYGDPAAGQTAFAVDIVAVLNIYIKVDGKLQKVNIPTGIGNFDSRGAFYTSAEPVITSNPGGTLLRMRDVVDRPFTLGEFFQNWGISLSSSNIGRYITGNGNKLTMLVNGKPNNQFENYVIQSKSRLLSNGSWLNTSVDRITLVYS